MKMVKKVLSYLIVLVLIVTAVTSTGVVANASMLPLEEIKAYFLLGSVIDVAKSLDEIPDFDATNVPVKYLLSMLMDSNGNMIPIDESATVVWSYIKDDTGKVIKDEFHELNRDETVDLSNVDNDTYTLELIVGSGNQLDARNKRYIVRVYQSMDVTDAVGISVCTQDEDGTRWNIYDSDSVVLDGSRTIVYENHSEETYYYVGFHSNMVERPDVHVKVFATIFNGNLDGTGLERYDITDQVLNVDMSKPNAGYRTKLNPSDFTRPTFSIVYYDFDYEEVYGQITEYIQVKNKAEHVDGELFYYDGGEKKSASVWESTDSQIYVNENGKEVPLSEMSSSGVYFTNNIVYQKKYMLDKELSVDDNYRFSLIAYSVIWPDDANKYVVKAVNGLYNKLSETYDEPDIKEQVISPVDSRNNGQYGYEANFKNGQYFTVFFKSLGHENDTEFNDNNVTIRKYKVSVIEYNKAFDPKHQMEEYSDAPIVGAADPWFRVNGIKSGNNNLDTYVVENGKAINMDTLYGYGYQTLLVNDKSADLANAKPTFWFGDADRVETYVGSKQESGVSSQDFSSGAVQYSTIIDDHVKNYQVNIVKKQSGAKLYVNGPSTREIFLDEYFEYKHDILVANIGDAPLTGLKVELNAENVKLDDYWTIGGANNDTLAAFTTTETSSKYGELANIGKIRLLPDGDGDVSGTIKISADGQEPVIINLSGRASNPEIITKKLDDAVKFVPYSYVVATNNMNDWNDVTFSLESGSLPDGLQLYPKTGEIYGVPKESGTYNITVKATYSRDDYFEPSYADLTLVVKDNTNDNVYNASDEGYTIKVHLGTETANSHEFLIENIEKDQLFVSNGEFDEFIDLWLNGEKLEEGVDYSKESGSTKLTIKSQTFENKANKDGNNTIAMEYRKNGNRDEDLRRTSQNFIVDNKPQTDSALENVISLINAIPSTSSLTLSDKSTVQSARSAYNALNSTQKSKVTNYSKLTSAEAQISNLEAQEAADRAAAQKVIDLINKIPDSISIKDKPTVQTARNGYDGLTNPQQGYVTNYSKLVSAENTINNIEGYISAAQPVIDKIDAIPNQIALENKGLVTTARTAYDNLTAKQKEYVTNYAKLTAAESAIATLEAEEQEKAADIAAAQPVINKINAIPSPVTLDSKNKVTEARSAYNLLTSKQKPYVTNYDKLTAAESTIAKLEAEQRAEEESQAQINAVITKINALPATSDIKLSDKSKVVEARNAYDALSNAQKTKVLNYDTLTNAESAISALESAEQATAADKAAADSVIKAISDLPSDITLDDKATVEAARSLYDSLTESQKQLVTNYDVLESAEGKITALGKYEAASEADKLAADSVISLINEIPDEISLADKEKIEAARAAYDKLTETQKSIVTNYDVLTQAEVKLAEKELEEHDNKPVVKTVTMVTSAVGKDGKPLSDYIIEVHSIVQQAKTDENGYARFSNVEIADHTVTIKDAQGAEYASKPIKIVEGEPLSLDGDTITAKDGETFTLSMEVEKGNIKLLSVASGDKTPEVKPDDSKKTIDISDSEKDRKDVNDIKETVADNGNNGSSNGQTTSTGTNGAIQTGDRSNLVVWYLLLIVSWSSLIAIFIRYRKRRTQTHNFRH